jgi:hypothetical protein
LYCNNIIDLIYWAISYWAYCCKHWVPREKYEMRPQTLYELENKSRAIIDLHPFGSSVSPASQYSQSPVVDLLSFHYAMVIVRHRLCRNDETVSTNRVGNSVELKFSRCSRAGRKFEGRQHIGRLVSRPPFLRPNITHPCRETSPDSLVLRLCNCTRSPSLLPGLFTPYSPAYRHMNHICRPITIRASRCEVVLSYVAGRLFCAR